MDFGGFGGKNRRFSTSTVRKIRHAQPSFPGRVHATHIDLMLVNEHPPAARCVGAFVLLPEQKSGSLIPGGGYANFDNKGKLGQNKVNIIEKGDVFPGDVQRERAPRPR